MTDEMNDEIRDVIRDEMGDEMEDKMKDQTRDALAREANAKDFFFPPAGAVFNGKWSSIATNRQHNHMKYKIHPV